MPTSDRGTGRTFWRDNACLSGLGVLFAYLALACVLFWPLVRHFSTHILADDAFIAPGRSDAYNFLWTYWWIQKAARTFHDLYLCDWVLPPTGANLYFHTHVILPTLLTLPLGVLFGSVAGYNGMVLLLLSGAASVYYAFLKHTLSLGTAAAFITGALFGFCPYFVFKLHAHVNLAGAVFWGAALFLLLDGYLHGRFGMMRGFLFSLCFWATFWTSFVELFALSIVVLLVVILFELYGVLAPSSAKLRERAWFFAMVLPGLISLASLSKAPGAETVDIALYPNLTLDDVLALPRLSIFGDALHASRFEYWGSHLPLVFVVLAVVGLPLAAQTLRIGKLAVWLALMALLLILTFNPADVASTFVRALPMGGGFRVFGRFLPLFLFFLLMLTGFGIERLLSLKSPLTRASLLAFFLGAVFIELYPFHLSPSAVKRFEVPSRVRAEAERGVFTWIMPRGRYTNALDTYQVSMDIPVVQLSYLARRDREATERRLRAFPALYGAPRISEELLKEMKLANVRYVLFEDARSYQAHEFPGEKIAESDGALLVRYGGP